MTARDDDLRADLRALEARWTHESAGGGTEADEVVLASRDKLRSILDAHEPDTEPEAPRKHEPYTDDGVTYCGFPTDHGVIDGCGEVWPCSTVRASATEPEAPFWRGRLGSIAPVAREAAAKVTTNPATRCHCGKYPLDTNHTLALYDSDDTAVERHAVGACATGIEADGCDCTELCSMGPTCPGGMLAGLPGAGCWRTEGQA